MIAVLLLNPSLVQHCLLDFVPTPKTETSGGFGWGSSYRRLATSAKCTKKHDLQVTQEHVTACNGRYQNGQDDRHRLAVYL